MQNGIVLRWHTDQLQPWLGNAKFDNNYEYELLDSADQCDDFSFPDTQPITQDPPLNHPPEPPKLPPALPIHSSVRSRKTVDHGPLYIQFKDGGVLESVLLS